MALTYQEGINDSNLHLFRLSQSSERVRARNSLAVLVLVKSGVKVRRSGMNMNA